MVIQQVVQKGVGEVWLNPGADSDALIAKARALGVRPTWRAASWRSA